MAEWEIGFVPKGWVKGDDLYFINGNFIGGQMACVARYVSPVEAFDSLVHGDNIFGVQFHYSQKDKVANWLDWWRSKD